MRLEIPFGDGVQVVSAPDDAAVARPAAVPARDEGAVLSAALAAHLGGKSLERFLEGGRRVALVVNDAFRATPTARILPALWPALAPYNPRVIVAAGNHRACSDAEVRRILGPFYDDVAGRITVHSSTAAAEMARVGETALGTPVSMNRAVLDADRLVVVGSVEPHYFAGFTGGRKGFLPGVSAVETIRVNHRRALSEAAQLGVLAGNPAHEDMEEAAALVPTPRFGVMVVLDGDDRIYAACAGGLGDSFYGCVEPARDVYGVAVDGKYDVVVTVAPPPLDVNLYQAHKAVEAARLVVKAGGAIILVTSCRDGIGDRAFYDILEKCNGPDDVARVVGDGYEIGWHQPVRLAAIARFADLYAVTALEDAVVEKTFARPCKTVQAALDGALRTRPGGRVLFLMSGSTLLPLVT